MMKNVICAIARNEKKYIADFCNYHLNLGFDEIHIYDNGQNDFSPTDKRIIVHPFTDFASKCPQLEAYKDFMETVDYDWCAFIDIDEFITLDGYSKINDYLSTIDKDVSAIKLFDKVYGDDGLITPKEENVPVYDRIKNEYDGRFIVIGKYITKKIPNMSFKSPHKIASSENLKVVLSNGAVCDESKGRHYSPDLFKNCFIRHYHTKTLSEFCDQKLNTTRVFDQTKKRTIDYFFQVNEKTPEKIAYLKSRGIDA